MPTVATVHRVSRTCASSGRGTFARRKRRLIAAQSNISRLLTYTSVTKTFVMSLKKPSKRQAETCSSSSSQSGSSSDGSSDGEDSDSGTDDTEDEGGNEEDEADQSNDTEDSEKNCGQKETFKVSASHLLGRLQPCS